LDKQQPLSDRQKEHVFHILQGGEHLLRLIDDILDLSRIEAGGVSISAEPVNVVDVLDEVKRTLEPMAAAQGVRVEVELSPGELPMITADRTRFAQILMNFGSNAIKYNRPGGRLMFVVEMPVAEFLRVSVRDTGLGIPLDKQAKLFQPFQRAGQEAGPIQGTGIGLVITKRLAELMKGDVGFRSVPGQGSEFWVDVPQRRDRGPSSVPTAPLTSVTTRRVEGRGTVLYVEDNPANVSFMSALMDTFENVELITASTAEVGLELARARLPDVIIMDVNLPGMSGLDALAELRSSGATQHIPVIALSAAATERDRRRGTQAGFYHYLTKPVKVDEFIAALEPLLGAVA
jgi:CheY-like chemotaxis protein